MQVPLVGGDDGRVQHCRRSSSIAGVALTSGSNYGGVAILGRVDVESTEPVITNS